MREFKPEKVCLNFVNSPVADFLCYLLYRTEHQFNIKKEINMEEVDPLNEWIKIQEKAALLGLEKYDEVFLLVEEYHPDKIEEYNKNEIKYLTHSEMPSYERLIDIIEKGEKYYDLFLDYWKKKIEPIEIKLLEKWKKQNSETKPMNKLQNICRLSFPFKKLNLAAMALHTTGGSAMVTPPGILSLSFDEEGTEPDISWFIGHEATHLLLGAYPNYGVKWREHPFATKAIKKIKNLGFTEWYIEESCCLFMQVALSKECNYLKENFSLLPKLQTDDTPKAYPIIYKTLEDNWNEYKYDSQKWPTIIDYLLEIWV